MRKIILLVALFLIWASSAPNVDRFAQIIAKDGGSPYVDSEGKLWILATKWHTEKAGIPSHTSIVLRPDGTIDSIYHPPRLWERRVYPYLYFRLYDKNGNRITEGTLQDSVEGGEFAILKNGQVLIITWVRTDFGIRQANPTSGYTCLILLDRYGNIKQKHKFLQPEYLNMSADYIQVDYDGNLYLHLSRLSEFTTLYVIVDDGGFRVGNKPQIPSPSVGIRKTVVTEFLKGNIPFSCQQVDTFRMVGKRGDMDARMEDYRFFPDSIQVLNYDFDAQQWRIKRYHLLTASFRKFENFDLYPLENYPTKLIQDEPIYESVRLKNDYIVVTVFMKENDKPIAYQMLFDSLGRYIVPEKMQIMKPKDIKEIPDGSKIYIKSFPVEGSWYKGKYRATNVYIWGYDLEDGMLYWKKYRIE